MLSRPVAVSHWDDWNPRGYVADYFGRGVDEDERAAIAFQIAFLRRQPRRFSRGLEFGCGPTLMRAIAAATYVDALDMADRFDANLDRVRAWTSAGADADDWRPFTDYALRCEGVDPNADLMAARDRRTREVIDEIMIADALSPHPLGTGSPPSYDLLVSSFCLDSLSQSHDVWRSAMRNVFGVLKPGGAFILLALRGCTRYRVGDRWFPAANLRRSDLESSLAECGADPGRTEVMERDLPSHAAQGYEGILLASGFTRD